MSQLAWVAAGHSGRVPGLGLRPFSLISVAAGYAKGERALWGPRPEHPARGSSLTRDQEIVGRDDHALRAVT